MKINAEGIRKEKPTLPWDNPKPEEGGPSRPKVTKPDNKNLLDRMRRVDKDLARQYRQRSGQ